MFVFDEIEGKRILKSTLLKDVKHFFTTREIPLSNGSLNDLKDTCTENRIIVSKYLGICAENLLFPTQTHTDNVDIAASAKKEYIDTDALVTDKHNIALGLNFADCVPVILWDKILNVGGIAHAGWRGTAKKIAEKTVITLCEKYGSKPANILAAIGPAIGKEFFSVDLNVFEQLKNSLPLKYDNYWDYSKEENKYYLDLKYMNYLQLREVGVEKIDLCGYCTCASNDIFFSYRKENGLTARHSAVLKLEEQ